MADQYISDRLSKIEKRDPNLESNLNIIKNRAQRTSEAPLDVDYSDILDLFSGFGIGINISEILNQPTLAELIKYRDAKKEEFLKVCSSSEAHYILRTNGIRVTNIPVQTEPEYIKSNVAVVKHHLKKNSLNYEELVYEIYSFICKMVDTELFNKMHNGDLSARDRLITKHRTLVGICINNTRRFNTNKISNVELFGIGEIGLIKAIDNFNQKLDVEFSIYATPIIIKEIKMYLRSVNFSI